MNFDTNCFASIELLLRRNPFIVPFAIQQTINEKL